MRVMCVLKSGGIYTSEHVEMLRRQLPRGLELVCLTDMDVDIMGVTALPLMHDFPGWWSKIELFSPKVACEPTVYLDLDVLVHGDIYTLFHNKFTAYRDFIKPDKMNSSVMSWLEPPIEIYLKFMTDPNKYMQLHRRWPNLGDQAFIGGMFIHDFYENGLIRSYRKECMDGVPEGTVIVAYHGKPKPWDT